MKHRKLPSLNSVSQNWNKLVKRAQSWKEGGGFKPVPSVDCTSMPQASYPFCDTSIDQMARAIDLVSRLSLAEKIDQTSTIAPAIPRLGIKDYNWRSNCLHGWSESGGHWRNDLRWTVFPAPIGLGATFNADLINSVGEVTASEGRALHNEMLVYYNGSSTEAAGLNCFSPNVNLFRDPRWGRGQETFSEDPYHISVIGNAYTNGLQNGPDKKHLKIAACAKHYAVHSGPENIRLKFVAEVSLHDLYDTYLPSFKSQVLGAKVAQIMPAYSGLKCSKQPDGAPDAANPFLLKKILRGEFGATNISICSDNGGVVAVYTDHHYVSSNEKAAAVCMNATTDLDLGYDLIYPKYLGTAVNENMVDTATIDQSVVRNFYLRMLVGDFDPPNSVPYQFLDKTSLDTESNRETNLQAAKESIVLLKNMMGSLPLHSDGIKHIAVLGPNANDSAVLLSNYEGKPSSTVTVLQGIQNYLKNARVDYAEGCNIPCKDKSDFSEAYNVVQGADYVVMVMGLNGKIEAEGYDRVKTSCEGEAVPLLGLPGCQKDFVEGVIGINPRVILVLINGGPVSIPDLFESRGIIGIVEAFYPGALGGTAVASILFGDYNPSGRMPVSVYNSESDLPPAQVYDMSSPPGRTYRYSQARPLIPFGFGLSYSEFEYSALSLSKHTISICENLILNVTVENKTPDVPGDEVVQVYLLPPSLPNKTFFPKMQLVGFKKVSFLANTPVLTVTFEINPYLMSLVDDDGINYIFPGKYMIHIGPEVEMTDEFSISGSGPVTTAMCTSSPQCLAC